jgi:phosphohistidine phosphatase
MSYLPDYFYIQSAVMPYRKQKGELELMMITSRRKKRWVIPKGVQEADLTAAESAAKEALEEAGIMGTLSDSPIGSYQYQKWGGICTVVVFVMEVTKEFERWEEDFRVRKWFSLSEAMKRPREKKLRQLMRSLPEFLQKV